MSTRLLKLPAMAETRNRNSKCRPRRLPWTVFGVVGLAVAIAGCGGPDDGDGNQ